MVSDFAEFYFLTGCYEEGVDETKVYTLLLTKVISNLTPPVNYTVSQMVRLVQEKYQIEIPPTFVKTIMKGLQGSRDDLYVKHDTICILRIPRRIAEDTEALQQRADKETRCIFEGFNSQLRFNELPAVGYRDFQLAFQTYCNRIVGDSAEVTETGKLLIDWISGTYRSTNNIELKTALDRMIYSWLVYRYFVTAN